jgi:hypothetical protein
MMNVSDIYIKLILKTLDTLIEEDEKVGKVRGALSKYNNINYIKISYA